MRRDIAQAFTWQPAHVTAQQSGKRLEIVAESRTVFLQLVSRRFRPLRGKSHCVMFRTSCLAMGLTASATVASLRMLVFSILYCGWKVVWGVSIYACMHVRVRKSSQYWFADSNSFKKLFNVTITQWGHKNNREQRKRWSWTKRNEVKLQFKVQLYAPQKQRLVIG